ncbi:MAG TPA: vitamin K epoxide reductase family protein [Solirubrobacteraceae bacterium]|nr:vitamin K epoxide reductase family protein [Solirubrobacteraceae bacterium]
MSQRALRITLIVLTLLGLAVASYVTYVHYSGIKPACTAGEACTKVQTSRYAEIEGVPVALVGLIGYLAILLSLLAPEDERTRFLTAALTLGGFGFSLYLTYREVFSIHAICEECLSSAIIMTIMMCLSVWRYLRGDIDATRALRARTDAEEADAGAALGATQS